MKNMASLKQYATSLERPKKSTPEISLKDTTTIPFFMNIPEYALTGLMEKMKILNYVKKTDLSPEQNKDDAFFVLLLGNVSVISPYDSNHNSKVATLQIQEPRLGFSKALLLTEEVVSYFTISLEKSLYGYIPKNQFFQWMAKHPNVKFTLLGLFDD